jgi:hypothetical protein
VARALYIAVMVLGYASLVHAAAPVSPTAIALGIISATIIPGLCWPERLLRKWAQTSIANSPREVQRLGEHLFVAEYSVPPEIEGEVRLLLQSRGYEPDRDKVLLDEPAHVLWVKAVTLFQRVRGWEDRKRYRGFVQEAQREFDVLRQRFDQLSLKSVRTCEAAERLAVVLTAVEGEAKVEHSIEETVRDLVADLREDTAFFLRNLCAFIARGVLATTFLPSTRRREFRALGFDIETARGSVVMATAWAFCVLVVCLTGLFFVSPPPHAARPTLPMPIMVLMIATIQASAVAVATIPKRYFGFANENLRGRPPFGFIAAVGPVAMALAVAVGIGSRLSSSGVAEAWSNYWSKDQWPWLLMPFTTATVTAFLVQDGRWSRTASDQIRRLKDAAIMSVATASSLLLALWLIPPHRPMERVWSILGGLVIGFLLGYGIPSPFRDRRLVGASSEG